MQAPRHPETARRPAKLVALLALASLAMLLAACTIHESHGEGGTDKKVDITTPIGGIHTSEGKNKKVDITTPFGGIHVNTNNADPKATGMSVYPGARVRENRDDNNATVDMSLFGLKVVALKYVTDDSPDKVLDYYRKDLKTFGNVLECKGRVSHTLGKPGDSRELTCDDDDHGMNIRIDTDSTELKAGTRDRQHIVSVKPSGSGAEFSLVYVQLRERGGSTM
jgi:hypothetical protein